MASVQSIKLAQATLDLPTLQQYFHVKEMPERAPVVVVGEDLGDAVAGLSKFGKPVVLKREAELRAGEAFFRFKRIAIENNNAVVEFEYPPEGLGGRAKFTRSADGWAPTDVTLQEK